jgi:thiol peroxidase
MKNSKLLPYLLLLLTILTGCAATTANPMKINTGSVEPGTAVTMRGAEQKLLGTAIAVGDQLPATGLIAANTLEEVDLSQMRGKVLFLSIVPSIDTKVCEAQSHYLGEQGREMPAAIERITISRDTPFAQARFAKEAKLTDIHFLSDYKEGALGRSVGLLLEGSRLLARAVILVDAGGVVRYIQVVPELSNLPDLERAFVEAGKLVK